jgi:plastocyanin
MRGRAIRAAALAAATVACGSANNLAAAPPPQNPGFSITIVGFEYLPLNLRVPPGGTVTIINEDTMPHSVTSESTLNAFRFGSVNGVSFDTGSFSGTKSFQIPANAPSGTVIPYFCTVHLGTMVTPNGSITIDPTAVATAGP